MCAKRVFSAVGSVLLVAAGASGQNVSFQIVPLSGTVINPGPSPTILIQPGVVLPYEVLVAAQNNFEDPTTEGLAGFDFNVLTDFGFPQTSPFNFSPTVSPLFAINQGFGTFAGDDILGVTGFQNLAVPGTLTTGFALGSPVSLGTGSLVVPADGGTFTVNLTGAADLFDLTTGQVLTTPGIVGAAPGFTIVTELPDDDEPVDGDEPVGDDDEPVVIPGGSSGLDGSNSDGSDEPGDDQVAGDIPEGPPLAQPLFPGLCGFGAASALAATFVGLALMRRRRA